MWQVGRLESADWVKTSLGGLAVDMIRRRGSTWDMLGSSLLRRSEWVGLDQSRARGVG